MNAFLTKLLEYLASAGVRIFCGVLILVVGWILINKFIKAIDRIKKIQKLDKTVRAFFRSAINILLKLLLIVTCASIFGVPMTSFIALLATAGLAIGLALQGGLSNIAGGIILLIIKPFRVGDFISLDGADGTVTDMNIFYTILTTPDGKRVDIPNGVAASGKITNFSVEPYRRVDVPFVIPQNTDIAKLSELLIDMARNNSLVLTDDEHYPVVKLMGYEEDGIMVQLRVWTECANYWDTFFAMNDGSRLVFNANGVKLSNRQLSFRIEK
ncbi:MAG: mechanosensitive ion channel [Clostridia bacterium]|nr:mechanosensitive ion channel [Clostridia bacterium]